MDRNKETFNTWNKVATLYQDKFMDFNLYNDTYDFMLQADLKHGAKILEIGCGPGNITKYLLSKRPDLDILGTDLAPNMIELAQKNNPTASFSVMDCRLIGHLTARYDGIVGGFCLPYLSAIERTKLIHDCYHLLNDHGIIYLSFVEGDPAQSGFQVGSSGDRVYFYYHLLEELSNQLAESNFEALNSFKVLYQKSASETDTHTIIVARKKVL